jgi:hypothetical protein
MRLAFLFTVIVVSSTAGVFGTPAIRSVHKMQRDQEHDVGRRIVTRKARSNGDVQWVCGAYSSKNTNYGISQGFGPDQDETLAAAQKLCPECDQMPYCIPEGCLAFAAGESNRIFPDGAVDQVRGDLKVAQSLAITAFRRRTARG